MRRLQIYIEEEMDELLGVAARRDGRSKASIIREAVKEHLGGRQESDPLDEWVGSIDSEAGDIDAIVYGP